MFTLFALDPSYHIYGTGYNPYVEIWGTLATTRNAITHLLTKCKKCFLFQPIIMMTHISPTTAQSATSYRYPVPYGDMEYRVRFSIPYTVQYIF